jgi:carbon-monoxide dehydrogenase small subunit
VQGPLPPDPRLSLDVLVNGDRITAEIQPQTLLLDFLRDHLRLRGAKRSCDAQVCGTCTVLVDGQPVSACMFLAHETHGREVLTIEGFARCRDFARFAEAFARRGAVQCGFCTPGILLTLKALRDRESVVDAEAIRCALDGNLCRCTGYRPILAAAHDILIGPTPEHDD